MATARRTAIHVFMLTQPALRSSGLMQSDVAKTMKTCRSQVPRAASISLVPRLKRAQYIPRLASWHGIGRDLLRVTL